MKNRLHVYTGDGKGKTTAAMGLALRALGHGWPVLIAQWMKNGDSGEVLALRRFENAALLAAPSMAGFTFQMTAEQLRAAAAEQTEFARRVQSRIDSARPRLIVLDELCMALSCGLVDEAAARALVRTALQAGETVVTGRGAPDWLTRDADYLSRIEAEKHPFDTERLIGREGIEW